MITIENLHNICVIQMEQDKLQIYVHALNDTMRQFGIDSNRTRESAFLATVLYESAKFHFTVEQSSGSQYEGRLDLGNNQPGDGERYKGRGLIQITGRANYAQLGSDLGVPVIAQPELLEQPELATRSAGWFWDKRNLNSLADIKQFGKICQRVNGGWNGIDGRIEYYVLCRKEFG